MGRRRSERATALPAHRDTPEKEISLSALCLSCDDLLIDPGVLPACLSPLPCPCYATLPAQPVSGPNNKNSSSLRLHANFCIDNRSSISCVPTWTNRPERLFQRDRQIASPLDGGMECILLLEGISPPPPYFLSSAIPLLQYTRTSMALVLGKSSCIALTIAVYKRRRNRSYHPQHSTSPPTGSPQSPSSTCKLENT